MGRRRVRSATNRPRAERTRRRRVSKSTDPESAASSRAVRTARRASSSSSSASGAYTQPRVMISGPGEHLARLGVDGDDHHHHALLGQHPPVPQHPPADVADDAVHVQVAGRHLADEVDAAVGQLDHVAVLGQQAPARPGRPCPGPGGRGARGGGTRRGPG